MPENRHIILLFVEKVEKSLQKDVDGISDSIKNVSKVRKEFKKNPDFQKNFNNYATFFENIQILEKKLWKYCENSTSFDKSDEDELRVQLSNQIKNFKGFFNIKL